MKKSHKVLVVIGILVSQLAVAVTVEAKPINYREYAQKERIKQGIVSGSLTPQEAQRLAKGEAAIHQKEKAYRADGVMTPKERLDLQTDLSQLNHRIHHQKHDPQKQGFNF